MDWYRSSWNELFCPLYHFPWFVCRIRCCKVYRCTCIVSALRSLEQNVNSTFSSSVFTAIYFAICFHLTTMHAGVIRKLFLPEPLCQTTWGWNFVSPPSASGLPKSGQSDLDPHEKMEIEGTYVHDDLTLVDNVRWCWFVLHTQLMQNLLALRTNQ